MMKNKPAGRKASCQGGNTAAQDSSQLLAAAREDLAAVQRESLRDQHRLQQQRELLQLLVAKAQILSYEYDVAMDCLVYMRMTPENQCIEQKIEDFRAVFSECLAADGNRRKILQVFEDACQKSAAGQVEYSARLFAREGWYRSCYKSLADENGHVYAIVGYTTDIGAEVSEREKMLETVQRDSLTKLYNREMAEQLVNDRMSYLDEGEKGVLFLLDIDNFKRINDAFGHMAGDGFLRAITEAIRADFRGDDILGRVGGDEFIIFLHGFVSIDAIEKRAQRIIDMFLRLPNETIDRITCSVGIVAADKNTMTYAELISKADEALCSAKNRGKNRYRMYGEDKY